MQHIPDDNPFGGPLPSDDDIPEPVAPELCDKCHKVRKSLINTGTKAFPQWLCGTCQHREARSVNTREMYGKGRRGY